MAANNKLCCTLALGALLCLGLAALIQAQGEWQQKAKHTQNWVDLVCDRKLRQLRNRWKYLSARFVHFININ